MDVTIDFTVNGRAVSAAAEPGRTLLDLLREDLKLTGAKYGCGEGQCGACTVLMDGKPVRSCVMPATAAAGKAIITIEGLAGGDALHPVQEAFLAEGAFQCGYCTPGMVLAAAALLAEKPEATDAEIAVGLEGHICRCGTYPRILKAVRRAAGQMRRPA